MQPAWTEPSWESLIFWTAYAACVVPEIAGSFFQNSAATDRHRDRGSLRLLIAGTAATLFFAFNLAFWLPALLISSRQSEMLVAGSMLTFAGIGFRWYAISVLGRFFTRDVAIRAGHRIVRDGPYLYLRHPSYSGYLLAMLGVGISLDNWASLALLLAANIAIYTYRMSVEERALTEAFGSEYLAYQRETKRVIPLIY